LLQNLHISKIIRNFAAQNKTDIQMPSVEVQEMIPKIQAYLATQPVERAYLFGSCSRGEETPDSDVDLLVTYTDSDSLSLMDIGGMVSDLRKIVHRPVDLIEDDYLMPFARKSADHDKIKIYERAY
jgi:predicted nucleotidyltransferase